MKKRIVLGLTAAAAALAMSAPASAHYEFVFCGPPTSPSPCGICVEEAGVTKCVRRP